MPHQTTTEPKRRYAREPQDDASNVTASNPGAPRRRSKISIVLCLMQRENGATLAEMMKATDWLAHTTRAALTGLKKRGHALSKDKRDGVTCYRAAKDAE